MTRRFWGLTRRQTVAVVAGAAVVGIAIGIVLGPSGGGSEQPTRAAPTVERVKPGSAGAADAVWVFGFETLRFDDRLEGAQQLGVRGFGSVQGDAGRVFMYDPATGRVGSLDARGNRLSVIGQLPPGTAEPDAFLPSIARSGATLWLVSAPGMLTPLDLGTSQVGQPVAVVSVTTATSLDHRATGVAAGPGGVFTATRTPGGIEVARIDPATGTVVGAGGIDGSETAVSLGGIAVDAARLWVLSGSVLYAFDPATLELMRTDEVEERATGSARGLVAAGGDAWMLTDNGATLTRLRTATGELDPVLRILRPVPDELRIPASLVADGDRVFVMVRRQDDAEDLTVRVVGFDTARDVSTGGIDVPGEIAPGALAVSWR